MDVPESQAKLVKIGLKEAFRSPTTVGKLLKDYNMIDFFDKYSAYVIKTTSLPPFLVSLASGWLQKSNIGKVWEILRRDVK